MATRTITLNILLNGTGTEIPSLLTTDPYELYLIQGSTIAIGNYALVPTGTPSLGLTYKFKYKATLDITTNSKTFSLFGTNITQEQLNKNWSAECYYNGTSWDIILDMDFSEAGIISSTNLQSNIINTLNLANGSVTTPKLANLAVTDAKLASDAVTTSKILDANVTTAKIADDAVTTVKVLDSNITTAKINDLAVTTNKLAATSVTNAKVANDAIDTANIIDNAVTNSKLALGTPSSVKIVDAAGDVQDLVLGADELPIGNGTTVTTINKTSLVSAKQIIAIAVPISFEAGEQTTTKTVWYPLSDTYYLSSVYVSVIDSLSGTDAATLDVNIGGQPIIIFNTPNALSTIIIPLSTPAGTGILYSNTSVSGVNRVNPIASTNPINLVASKTTPGGKIVATIILHEL